MLGNMIGEGRSREAERIAKTILMTIPLIAAAIGVLIFIAAPVIPHLFNISDYVSNLVVHLLRIFTIVLFVKASNMHIIVGMTAQAEETLWFCAGLELLPLWFLSIPLMALAGLVLHLPPPYSLSLLPDRGGGQVPHRGVAGPVGAVDPRPDIILRTLRTARRATPTSPNTARPIPA